MPRALKPTSPAPAKNKGGGSKPRITPKLAAAVEALIFGRATTQGQAADLVGMERTALCRAMARPHVQEYIRQAANARFRSLGVATATATLQRLITAASSEYVQADAAKHVLAIAGVKPQGERVQGGGGGVTVQIVLHHHGSAALSPPTVEIGAQDVQSDDAAE